jgi:hypothetical protein
MTTTTTGWVCRRCGGSAWVWVERRSHDGRESRLVRGCVKHGAPVKYGTSSDGPDPLVGVTLASPFSDLADEVICLRFAYNSRLADGLKECLRQVRLQVPGRLAATVSRLVRSAAGLAAGEGLSASRGMPLVR